MQHRRLGSIETSAIGLGCMGMAGMNSMTAIYGAVDLDEAFATLHRAIELGITLFDTAEVYGPYRNEELVAEGLKGKRDQVLISTKFGFRIEDGKMVGVDSRPSNIRSALEGSLKRLKTDHVDIYFQHRVDPEVAIERVMETLAALKQEGKIRAIGLSEAGPETIRRAHAVHPVDVLQSEYSLWERSIEEEILPLCRELGIGLMPYSPLGRGFLTGHAKRAEEYPEDDYRHNDPRYQGANYDQNMKLVRIVEGIADKRGASAAQVALAWLLDQGPDIVPIPGAKRRATLEDSAKATSLKLDIDDIDILTDASRPGTTAGARYQDRAMKMVRL